MRMVSLAMILLAGCDVSQVDVAVGADDVSTGELTQEITSCLGDCDCPQGTFCENGTCATEPIFGPPPPMLCYADCQCPSELYCANSPGSYGMCRLPEITYRSSNFTSCGNTGVAHPSPDYLVRTAILGPPGARVRSFNRHVSCGASAQWWEDTSQALTIGNDGKLVITYPTNAPFACDYPVLGRWQSYVVIDGMASPISTFTYSNSACSGSVSTCASAANYCPPSGPCNGPGCP